MSPIGSVCHSGAAAFAVAAKEARLEHIVGRDAAQVAVDALQMMGPTRYAGRADIMNQLRILANDKTTYQPLQKKSAQLLKGK